MVSTIYNPFEKHSDKKLLLVGIIFSFIGAILAYVFKAKFDGVLDLHFDETSNIYQILTFLILNIAILTNVLIITGKYINKKTRIIDIYTTVLISRIPIYLATTININGYSYNISKKIIALVASTGSIETIASNEILFIILQSFVSMIMLVWTITLLYNGFKTATNMKETKHKIIFAITIIVAEIISKVIIYKFL